MVRMMSFLRVDLGFSVGLVGLSMGLEMGQVKITVMFHQASRDPDTLP